MTTMTAQVTDPHAHDESGGGRLVAADGRELPLVSVRLSAEARGGVARTALVQVFENRHADPLRVTYQLPLPHRGAVSGFSFRLGDRRIAGEVDLVQNARERFEEALLSGRTAAIVDQVRGSLFVQELGNVPPGARVEAELTIDQRLDWLGEGAWEWRFPTAVAPRYQGAPGRVPDAARTFVDVADGPVPPRLSLELTIRDALAEGRRPESPSHPLALTEAGGALRAELSGGGPAQLDRDVVIRWPVAAPEVGVSLCAASPGGRLGERAFGLLTLVPPAPTASPRPVSRDLILLLDASGSMSGEPLDQARRVASALVDSLGDEDQLELVKFASSAVRWHRGPVAATEAHRKEAKRWLARLDASGGTEMRDGIREALRGVRPDAQRQVVLFTDGLIGAENEVVAEILATLPAGSRLHAVGVGSAVNRSLTGPAARAGRGLEVVIGLGEDPERAAAELRARTAAPLVTELTVSGSALVACAPARLPDLFAGAPALVSLELAPGGGSLTVRGLTAGGGFERRLEVAAGGSPGSSAAAALFGREAVEDLEMHLAAGEEGEPIDRAVEQLGLAFQISTRLTSWVAVSEERTVDPTRPTRRERIPQELPYGMSAEGLGLRSASGRVAPSPPAPAMRSLQELAGAGRDRTRALRVGAAKRGVLLDAPTAASGAGPREQEEGFAGERRLAAGLRATSGGQLVLEAEVTGAALAWDPPVVVRVRLDDGSLVEVELDAAATTAAATLTSGQVLRLVLRATGLDPARVAEVVLEGEGSPLVLWVKR